MLRNLHIGFIAQLVLQAGPEIHRHRANLQLDAYRLRAFREENRHLEDQMQAAVAVRLGIGNVVFLLDQRQVVLPHEHVRYRVNILDKRTDYTDTANIVQIIYRVDKMMESARGQADNILKNARMTAETVFDELETLKKKAQKKNADQNLAAAKAALRGVITQTENEQRRGIQKRVVEADEIRSVQKGDRVRLLNVGGVIATVLAPADRDGGVQVQAGPMKMTVKENELRLVEEKKNAPKPKPQPRRDAPRRELNIRSAESEVDVRGMSAEEALFEVDNFLSRAIMAGLPSVTVIHGKGTGVLRTAVQQHLRRNKRVKSVRSGVYGEGEQGVTIVELR